MEGRGQKSQKMGHIIYGQPLTNHSGLISNKVQFMKVVMNGQLYIL